MKEKPICKFCGSENITQDATVMWIPETQSYSIADVYDSAFCIECQDDTNPQWVEIDD